MSNLQGKHQKNSCTPSFPMRMHPKWFGWNLVDSVIGLENKTKKTSGLLKLFTCEPKFQTRIEIYVVDSFWSSCKSYMSRVNILNPKYRED